MYTDIIDGREGSKQVLFPVIGNSQYNSPHLGISLVVFKNSKYDLMHEWGNQAWERVVADEVREEK